MHKNKSSKNFENKVLKFFPKTEENDIYIDSVNIEADKFIDLLNNKVK